MSNKSLKQYLEYLKYSGFRDIFVSENNEELSSSGGVSNREDKSAWLAGRREEIKDCRNCGLHEGRINLVYGQGDADAKLMLIGEGPGAQENQTGKVFVGRAGQLLTKMLGAINIQREEVFIANIVKCRPPGNRDPHEDERRACLPYLIEQIDVIKPHIIMLLGKVAGNTILQNSMALGKMRQQVFTYRGIPTYVSYHPSALLRNPQWKRPAWEDLKKVRDHYLNLPSKY